MPEKGITMDVPSAILDAGLLAVDTYITCAGQGISEDSVPERSLSAFMALHLQKILEIQTRLECPYTRIVEDLKMSADELSLTAIRQRTADIALYKNGLPVAVIELKVFTDAKAALPTFAEDLIEGDPVHLSERVRVYAVALICQTKGRPLDEQKVWIERGVGRRVTYSRTMQTNTGEKWEWCFGCVERGPI
jgi:hypothetical protein